MLGLFPTQQKAISLLSKENGIHRLLIYGGSRSGKTFSITNKMYLDAYRNPKTNQAIIRKDLGRVRRTIIKGTGREICQLHGWRRDIDYHYDGLDNILTFNESKSKIHFAGLDSEDSLDRLLGNEFSRIMIDEAQETRAIAYNRAETRLAEASNIPLQLILLMNPGLKTHYSYQVFFKGKIAGTKEDRTDGLVYETHQMNPVDNPLLPKETLASLKSKPKRELEQFYKGEFGDVNESTLFSAFNYQRSIKTTDADALAIGIDPAITHKITSDKTGIVLAGKLGNKLIFFKEYSGRYRPDQMAEIVANLQENTGAIIVIESNQGGDYLQEPIRMKKPNANIKLVSVGVSKIARLLPLQAKYSVGDVIHAGQPGELEELEEQLMSMSAEGYLGEGSPDSVDAAIMAATHLFPALGKNSKTTKTLMNLEPIY